MKILAKFYWDCGRNGEIESVFITTKEQLDSLVGKNIYFGEVLGKHSQVHGIVEKDDLSIVTEDQDFIEKYFQFFGNSIGYNPFSYLPENVE